MKGILLMAIVGTALLTGACKKYEDGPMLSLRTEKKRLVNTWDVEKAYYSEYTDTPENGQDRTESYEDYVLEFKKDDTYRIENISLDKTTRTVETGGWTFMENEVQVQTTGVRQTLEVGTNEVLNEEEVSHTWRIRRLKNKELWVWYEINPSPPWMYFRFSQQ